MLLEREEVQRLTAGRGLQIHGQKELWVQGAAMQGVRNIHTECSCAGCSLAGCMQPCGLQDS